MIKALATALGLSAAVLVTPVAADPNPQLVNSVQQRVKALPLTIESRGIPRGLIL